MKNTHSFFSWQGNNLDWPPYTKWIVFSIIILLFICLYIFRNKIRSNKEGKIFKNKIIFYRFVGSVGLIYMIIKLIIYIVGDYPLYWENLQLHICRIHFIIMMIFLIIGKPRLIMYTTFISSVGAIGAIYFGDMSQEHLTNSPLKKIIFDNNNIKFYNVGADNFFFYDFFIFHIMLIMIPVFMWTKYEWRMSTVNKYRTIIIYIAGILLMWTFNIISKSFSDEWKANNWYIGPDEHNDYSNVLGWLSGWPQNLFSYILLGVFFIFILNFIYVLLLKNRSEVWNKNINDYKGMHKRIFNFKDNGY